jgi:hypothetical protein
MNQDMFCEPHLTNFGRLVLAEYLMPQSSNKGININFIPTCHACRNGWWDGASWNGEHLEFHLGASKIKEASK